MDLARLHELLERTSRTFALCIPRLPEPTHLEVTVAYLLFRIADTFEDATRWSGIEQREALAAFTALLSDPSSDQAAVLADIWTRHPPVENEAYEELLRETPGVLAMLDTLRPGARAVICHHVARTAEGMADFVNPSADAPPTEIVDLDGLRAYCYIVAGIVGEMLTDLFLLSGDQLAPAAQALRDRAAAFGEGLQLTNILKDAGDDEQEGRQFLPRSLERSRVFDVARDDLRIAREYTGILQDAGAEPGLVAFNALPLAMAEATLDRVERDGPGAKITRLQVAAIIGKVDGSIRLGRRIFPQASVPGAVE
ncbi:MAG: hypothetical protein BMS9Abin29_1293 [Gemmatimonadota bacterium]|nr:MAG: hypothetical protein BMS9Abin29_1293 [Gemmatimonadota bacterium]